MIFKISQTIRYVSENCKLDNAVLYLKGVNSMACQIDVNPGKIMESPIQDWVDTIRRNYKIINANWYTVIDDRFF